MVEYFATVVVSLVESEWELWWLKSRIAQD